MRFHVGRFTLVLVRIVQVNKDKIFFIVTSPIVTMEWLLLEGKFETKARILGMRLATARLLSSFVTISKNIFSLYLVE